VCDIVDLYYV